DATITFVDRSAATADRAVEEIAVTESDRVTELVCDHVAGDADAEVCGAELDVDGVERLAVAREAGHAASGSELELRVDRRVAADDAVLELEAETERVVAADREIEAGAQRGISHQIEHADGLDVRADQVSRRV